MKVLKILVLLYPLIAVSICQQRFELLSSSRSPRLQVDAIAGKVYTSAGNQLYRLDSNLQQEEAKSLTSESLNISLSSDGRWLVVCLTDLSCEVYNATNFAQRVFRGENILGSPLNISLFAAEDSFHVGSFSTGQSSQILLSQHYFAGNRNGSSESGTYDITRNEFQRHFFSGFVSGSNAYYFATDNNPSIVRSFRVMRVCHNSDFGALYELSLGCGSRPSLPSRINGVTAVDNFAGISGTTVVLSTTRPTSTRNSVCVIPLETIDRLMQQKFDSCTASTTTIEQYSLAWKSDEEFCSSFLLSADICQFMTTATLPLALDDAENNTHTAAGNRTINIGANSVANFITAMTAAVVEEFSFIFVAFITPNGENVIIGFDVKRSSINLAESDGFGRRTVADGPVDQLQLDVDSGLMYATTDVSVLQFPIADCASQPDCTSCLGDGNPLCGWCLVENKCSKISECQNSFNDTRWIRANRTNSAQCPSISISPDQYSVDDPTILTLTLTQSLPSLLDGESYLCHFDSNGVNFTVDAVGSGTVYTCNITGPGRIPAQFQGPSTVLNVSLASSLLMIPFSTSVSAFTIYRCSQTSNCSSCLQTNNACGWCVYNKVCSGTADPCINGTDTFLKLNLGASQTYVDVCPLLDQPPSGENYVQPVLVNRNIELVTRNLPAEMNDFIYMCRVNGIDLSANYNNMSSLTCIVDGMNQLTLPSGTGQQSVDVSIRWVRPNINHPIDALTPVSVILFDCAELAEGCSSCLGSGFDCRWCDRPSTMTDSCTYTGECTAMSVSTGASCPLATVNDFNPTSGPMEGGTTITFTGRELGVTFDDVIITVGGVPCTTTDREGYESGARISCITGEASSVGSNSIQITTLSGPVDVGDQFRIAVPQVVRVVPSLGPVAGGTTVTVYGSDLNIGNTENTGVTIVDGTVCEVDHDSIKANIINCTTPQFTGSPDSVGLVYVSIDNANVINNSVQFTFRADPEFNGVTPSNTIFAGGIELVFNGSNFYVEQNPVLIISDPEFMLNMSSCSVINFTAISCITPELTRLRPGDGSVLSYTIRIDNAQGPDQNAESLQIKVSPNPSNFNLVNSQYNTGTNAPIRIMGNNLGSVSNDAYNVTVGGEICNITAVTATEINCIPPKEAPRGNTAATVVVRVGSYLVVPLAEELMYVSSSATSDTPLDIIIPVVVGGLAAVVIVGLFIICCVVSYYRRNSKKSDQQWIDMMSRQTEMTNKGESSKYHQFSENDLSNVIPEHLVIPSKQLRLFDKSIGQGEFGIVYKAFLVNWRGHALPLTVAVKTMKALFTASDVEGMTTEITKMKEFDHPNVMSLIGVCVDAGSGVSIVMPFMENGSLLDYLRRERDSLYLSDPNVQDEKVLPVRKLLLRMCYQISCGMEYLALRKFVHRDLAARNCMLDSSGNVRVSDFGLAEDMYTTGYFRQDKESSIKLPFKWMAPESLRDGVFSEKSDVWSFGITCWEVFTAGRIPYPAVDAMSMLKILECGTRLEKPENAACSSDYFTRIFTECWALDPNDRPSFKLLSSTLDKILQVEGGYLELSMVLLPPGDETERYNEEKEIISSNEAA